jgi:hypothetical protein
MVRARTRLFERVAIGCATPSTSTARSAWIDRSAENSAGRADAGFGSGPRPRQMTSASTIASGRAATKVRRMCPRL